LVRDQGVAGSNPVSPTQRPSDLQRKLEVRGLRRLQRVNGPRHRGAAALKASSPAMRIRAYERLPNPAIFRGSTPGTPLRNLLPLGREPTGSDFRNSRRSGVAPCSTSPKCDPNVGAGERQGVASSPCSGDVGDAIPEPKHVAGSPLHLGEREPDQGGGARLQIEEPASRNARPRPAPRVCSPRRRGQRAACRR
jgi:hypothetical protein